MAAPTFGEFPRGINSAIKLVRGEVDALDKATAREVAAALDDTIERLKKEATRRGAVDGFRRQLSMDALDAMDATIDEFQARYGDILERAQSASGDAGVDFVRSRTVARDHYAEITSTPLFNPINVARMESLAALRTDLITGIGLESKRLVREAIQRGVLAGDSVHTIADAIADGLESSAFAGNISAKALTIARTESLRAYSTGHQIGINRLSQAIPGLRKRWVVMTFDSRNRESHVDMNGVVVGSNEFFNVGSRGVRLQYPRDPAGQGDPRDVAAETINCRCSHVIIFPDEKV